MNIFELIYKQIIEPRTRQISINPNEKIRITLTKKESVC